MDLRREIVTMIGVLVLLNVLLAFGAVGLFARMGPAIDEILRANVYSMAAAEDALVVLAEVDGDPVAAEGRATIEEALARLHSNVTEADEAPALAALQAALPEALAAPGPARAAVVRELDHLMTINREAMTRADADARRLGRAGAWASALLGALAFAVSLLVLQRARARLIAPIVELDEVVAEIRGGQVLRRGRLREAPAELVRVVSGVNELLDERAERQRLAPRDLAPALASALQGLLDEREAPTFVVDREGAILRMNRGGMALLGDDEGEALRRGLREAARGGDVPAGLEVQPLSNHLGFLCAWAPKGRGDTTRPCALPPPRGAGE